MIQNKTQGRSKHPIWHTSTFLKALRTDDLGQNTETINLVFLYFSTFFTHRANQEQNVGIIHASNTEHRYVFKSPCGDNPEQNAGTIHASNLELLLRREGTHTNIHLASFTQGGK